MLSLSHPIQRKLGSLGWVRPSHLAGIAIEFLPNCRNRLCPSALLRVSSTTESDRQHTRLHWHGSPAHPSSSAHPPLSHGSQVEYRLRRRSTRQCS
jgi:hypothetical protein